MNLSTKNSSAGDKIFVTICYIFIILVCILTVYPFVFVISASLSSAKSVMACEVFLWPKNFTWKAYEVVAHNQGIWTSYLNTIFYTVAGTALSIILTAMAAYPLSKKDWKAKKFFSIFIVFTIWFGGGMVPFYLVVRNLGLLNTRLGIILYPAVSAFYVIIMRTYFEGIPYELQEAAKLDGANEMRILFNIILPLSLPVIACIGLYYAVGRWNSYFWEMLFLKDQDKLPVQVLLQRIIVAGNLGQDMTSAMTQGEQTIPITIKYACIMVTALPIILVYPFVQKYFVKGVLLGGVKG